jgi:hypothetical protein
MSTRISREKVQLIIDDLTRELPDLTYVQGDDGSGNIALLIKDGSGWGTTERGAFLRILGNDYSAGFPTPTLVNPATDGRTLRCQLVIEMQAGATVPAGGTNVMNDFLFRLISRVVQQGMLLEIYAMPTASVPGAVTDAAAIAVGVAQVVVTKLVSVIPVSTSKSNIGA